MPPTPERKPVPPLADISPESDALVDFTNMVKIKEGDPFLEATKAFEDEDYLTIGWGRNNKDVKAGDTIDEDQANQYLNEDVTSRLNTIRKSLPKFDSFPKDLQLALFYEQYRGSLGQSPKTRKLINAGKYAEAAEEFLDNDEYKNAEERGRRGIRKNMKLVSDLLRRQGRR